VTAPVRMGALVLPLILLAIAMACAQDPNQNPPANIQQGWTDFICPIGRPNPYAGQGSIITSPPPFTIEIREATQDNRPGPLVTTQPILRMRKYKISITNRQQYYGIFLEVVPVDTMGNQKGTAVGYFDPVPSTYGVRLVSCKNSGINNALTHTSPDIRKDSTTVYTWNAPQSYIEHLKVRAILSPERSNVVNFEWFIIQSNTLGMDPKSPNPGPPGGGGMIPGPGPYPGGQGPGPNRPMPYDPFYPYGPYPNPYEYVGWVPYNGATGFDTSPQLTLLLAVTIICAWRNLV